MSFWFETAEDGENFAFLPYHSVFRRSLAYGIETVPLGIDSTEMPHWDYSLK